MCAEINGTTDERRRTQLKALKKAEENRRAKEKADGKSRFLAPLGMTQLSGV
jgi:hypothetical protein